MFASKFTTVFAIFLYEKGDPFCANSILFVFLENVYKQEARRVTDGVGRS